MKIGEWELQALNTGRFRLDGGAMFGVVPKVLWQKTNPTDEKNRIEMASRVLLIKGHGRKILVDCGLGQNWTPKQIANFGIDPANPGLVGALQEKGVEPKDITDVVISHFHFDHVGGALRLSGSGSTEMVFTKARQYVHEKNIEQAYSPTSRDRASFIEAFFRPLVEGDRLIRVTGEQEIAPGVSLIVNNGHTPGQLLVKVSDGKKTLLFTGDTIPTSSHVPVPYVMSYDNFPLTTMAEKTEILQKALAEKWVLFFCHDPFIAACTVRVDETKYVRDRDVMV